jgi:hypothetical protein
MNHSGARRRIVSVSISESRFSQASAPQGDDVFLIVNNPSPSTPQDDNDEFLISSDADVNNNDSASVPQVDNDDFLISSDADVNNNSSPTYSPDKESAESDNLSELSSIDDDAFEDIDPEEIDFDSSAELMRMLYYENELEEDQNNVELDEPESSFTDHLPAHCENIASEEEWRQRNSYANCPYS